MADDNIRYRKYEIRHLIALLAEYDVVHSQNRFTPLPWHARWDTTRSIINYLFGGYWPRTWGVRKSTLMKAGGYSGDVLFENLEMVRTVQAVGGQEAAALDLVMTQRPPTAQHFLSQRTRQTYDEWARPVHFATQLAMLPAAMWITRKGATSAGGSRRFEHRCG